MNDKIIETAINKSPELGKVITDFITIVGFKEFIICIILILLIVYSTKIINAIIMQSNKHRELETLKSKAEAEKLKEVNYQKMIADNKTAIEIITNDNIKYKEEAEYWRQFALLIAEKFQYSISVEKLEIIIDYTLGLRTSLSNEIKSRIMSIIERGIKEDACKLYNELYELFHTKILDTAKNFLFPDRELYLAVDIKCKEVIDVFLIKLFEIISLDQVEEKLDSFLLSIDGIRPMLGRIKDIFMEKYLERIEKNSVTHFTRKK